MYNQRVEYFHLVRHGASRTNVLYGILSVIESRGIPLNTSYNFHRVLRKIESAIAQYSRCGAGVYLARPEPQGRLYA